MIFGKKVKNQQSRKENAKRRKVYTQEEQERRREHFDQITRAAIACCEREEMERQREEKYRELHKDLRIWIQKEL